MDTVKLYNALGKVANVVGRELTTTQIKFLLIVHKAGSEGISITDIAETMKSPHSSVSRSVGAFSAKTMGDQALITLAIDQLNPKYRLISLTTLGRKAVDDMLKGIKKAVA